MSLEDDMSDVLLFENGISNIVMVQLSRALDIMFGAIKEKMPKFTQKIKSRQIKTEFKRISEVEKHK